MPLFKSGLWAAYLLLGGRGQRVNWEAVSAIGDVVGAAAVVISIAYLAVQVRGSSQSTKAAIYQGLHSSDAKLILTLLTQPTLARLFEGVDQDLTGDERTQFSMLMSQLFNNYELYFFLWREGMLPPDVASAMERIVARRLHVPGVSDWWQSHQGNFSPEFVKWVNGAAETA